jgi:hypothetical protein
MRIYTDEHLWAARIRDPNGKKRFSPSCRKMNVTMSAL